MENYKFWTLKGDDTHIKGMNNTLNNSNIISNAKEYADEWRITFARVMKEMEEDMNSLVVHEKL